MADPHSDTSALTLQGINLNNIQNSPLINQKMLPKYTTMPMQPPMQQQQQQQQSQQQPSQAKPPTAKPKDENFNRGYQMYGY